MNNLVFDYFNYEKIEKIDIGYKSPMIKIKNLKIINNSKYDTIKVDGKNFIFFLNNYFAHFMEDGFFQYEFLKNKNKEIQPYFLSVEKNHLDESINNLSQNYMKDIVSLYSNVENINNIYSHNFIFEEVYFMFQDIIRFDKKMYNKKDLKNLIFLQENWSNNINNCRIDNSFYDVVYEGSIYAKNTILKKIKKDNSYPEKIFISRKKSNEKYLTPATDEDSIFYMWDKKMSNRVFKKEEQVENFFINKGYFSISMEELNYLDQLRYLYNCKYLAGFVGSSFQNIFICDEDCNIFELKGTRQSNKYPSFSGFAVFLNLKNFNILKFNNNLQITLITNPLEILDKII